jgi:predicted GNAT family acetyltransferase
VGIRSVTGVITMPGKKMRSIKRPKVYEALRGKGLSKTRAAKIANSKKARKKK